MSSQPTTQIVLGQDGRYRWAYEFNLYRNPTILLVVAKILGVLFGIAIGINLVMTLIDVANGYSNMEDLIGFIKGCLIFALVFGAIVVGSYYIYAAMQGGKYCVMFEMDDTGVTHKQYAKQVEKAQVVGLINVLAGAATGNATQMGIGINSAVNTEMSSEFANVRSIKGYRRRGVIKVNEPLAKNQVYADGADYDFVWNYITSRCPNATIKG